MAKILLDGYQKTSIIGPSNGLPKVQIKFRPATSEEVTCLVNAPAVNAQAIHKERIKFAKAHLVGWDVEAADGSLAEITEENIAKVPYPYILKIIDEICSVGTGAEDAKN